MDYLGPFTYNGVRFILGALSITPLIIISGRKRNRKGEVPGKGSSGGDAKSLFIYGITAGSFLFLGASFQQAGIVYTTAGKAGFITGMYVVIVPFLGMFLGHKTGRGRWAGAALSITGLYLLSIRGDFSVYRGDLLVFLSAFFWASHVLVMASVSHRTDVLKLAVVQYAFCGMLSLGTALILESIDPKTVAEAWIPIFLRQLSFPVGVRYYFAILAPKEGHTGATQRPY